MKNTVILQLLLIAVFIASCGSSVPRLFSKKTPHEKYAEKLDDTNQEETPAGRQWLAASKTALQDPQTVELPYKQLGVFGADKPRALGLKFKAKRGEKLTFTVTRKANIPFVLYADLFKQEGPETIFLHSADTAASTFSIDADEASSYVLRLQPELFRTGEYTLSISVGPSLAFPVAGNKAKTGSFWGDSRDGGKRNHEGIDIFAPKSTPVVASADGVVTGVKEIGIGGKVIWLRLTNRNITLYYAHLDKQLVSEGQYVKKGDTLGLVGNTGNAKYTPAHLHFGIYTYSGPMDPLPFVNQLVKTAPAVPDKNLVNYLRLKKTQKLNDDFVAKANTVLVPVAVSSKGYISELPDGRLVQVPFSAVQSTTQPVKSGESFVGNPVQRNTSL
jgi:murein DD-endopeptidase MepM/ murein hydrolase activator NlpD